MLPSGTISDFKSAVLNSIPNFCHVGFLGPYYSEAYIGSEDKTNHNHELPHPCSTPMHTLYLSQADEAPEITSEGEAQRGQLAPSRSSTIKRTKRRTLKKSERRKQQLKDEGRGAITFRCELAFACNATRADLIQSHTQIFLVGCGLSTRVGGGQGSLYQVTVTIT